MKIITAALALIFALQANSQQHFVVHFDFDKYKLSPHRMASLDSFVNAEKTRLSKAEIRLNGHCDGIGSNSYNDKLSEKRVATIKKYLVQNGIPAGAIRETKAFGKRNPLNSNSTTNERSLNRRVEIQYIAEDQRPTSTSNLKEKIADTATVSGTNIILKNINFYGGMHQFLPESQPRLQELLDAMKSFPKLVIQIEGHICCHEGPGDGQDIETGIYNLSEARAKAIRDYLVTSGIEPARVTYKGFGHSAPIYPYPEKTEAEMTENRRVEIKIMSK